jgi:glycosyltransferase involved in cell wall biosynthesis
MTTPLLSIVIPIYNRATYLALTLNELRAAWPTVGLGRVAIFVSDNASRDETPKIVEAAIAAGLPVQSVPNAENLGSDANISQAFNLANGRYVLSSTLPILARL